MLKFLLYTFCSFKTLQFGWPGIISQPPSNISSICVQGSQKYIPLWTKNVNGITLFKSPCSEFIMICTKYFIDHEAEKVVSEWVGDLFYRTKVNQRLKVGTLMHLFVDSLSKKYVDLCYAHQVLCMNWSLQASTIRHWYFENVDVTEQFNYLPLVSTCRIWK